MDRSDTITLEFLPIRDHFVIYPRGSDGLPKEIVVQDLVEADHVAHGVIPEEIVAEEADDAIPEEIVAEEGRYVFDNSAASVVISKGVLPNANEVANINHFVVERGLGKGAVFIHKLTSTDLKHTGLVCLLFAEFLFSICINVNFSISFLHFYITVTFLILTPRIPKLLVPVIGVPPTGDASFVFGDFDVVTTSKYGPTADDRMRFNDGWQKFAKACKLKEGMMAVMLFHIIDGKLYISVDVVSN